MASSFLSDFVGAFSALWRLPRTLRDISEFQRVAVEDLKRQILGVEKRMDELNDTLGAMSSFDHKAVADIKHQVRSVELRLDELTGAYNNTPNNERISANDIRNEFANIRVGLDRHLSSTLLLFDRLEAHKSIPESLEKQNQVHQSA